MEREKEKEELREFKGTFFVFNTTHLTLKAEKLLNNAAISNRLFPKPRSVVSECGLILKVLDKEREKVESLFEKEALPLKEVLTLS